jgi:hypothetical protein
VGSKEYRERILATGMGEKCGYRREVVTDTSPKKEESEFITFS